MARAKSFPVPSEKRFKEVNTAMENIGKMSDIAVTVFTEYMSAQNKDINGKELPKEQQWEVALTPLGFFRLYIPDLPEQYASAATVDKNGNAKDNCKYFVTINGKQLPATQDNVQRAFPKYNQLKNLLRIGKKQDKKKITAAQRNKSREGRVQAIAAWVVRYSISTEAVKAMLTTPTLVSPKGMKKSFIELVEEAITEEQGRTATKRSNNKRKSA